MRVSTARFAAIGWVYLALALVGLGGALAVSYGFGLGVAESCATLLPTLAPLYLSWVTFHRGGHGEASLAEVADELARSVRGQWEAEVRMRRINDPYPLPVRWRPASPELVDEWQVQCAMAQSWPTTAGTNSDRWAEDPEALAGAGEEIAEVLTRRVPTRRLVVLGEPGSGKSMLLGRLLLYLLEDRATGGMVPVLLPLASWDPDECDLYAWMAARLATDYRGLGDAAPTRHGRASRARALLEDRLILPILDGLDELPVNAQAKALSRINEQLPPGQGIVLSSRSAEYRAVALPEAGLPIKLAGAAGIELTPLPADVMADYLRRDAGGSRSASADRWRTVLALLGSDAPIAHALQTPLMAFLARTIYNPRPGEQPAALPDPAELCDTDRLPSANDVRTHLYEAYLPAAYRPHPLNPCPWPAPQAEAAISYLARYLLEHHQGTADLAWWELHRATPRGFLRVAASLTTGLLTGLGILAIAVLLSDTYPNEFAWDVTAWQGALLVLSVALICVLTGVLALVVPRDGAGRRAWEWRSMLLGSAIGYLTWVWVGPLHGFVAGACCAMVVARNLESPAAEPAVELRWSWNPQGLLFAPACGIAATFAFGLASGLAFGIGGGLAFGILRGWTGSADLATAVGPAALLRRDRRIFLQFILVNGAAGALLGALVSAVLAMDADSSPTTTFTAVLLGLADGLALGASRGLVTAWSHAAWGPFTLSRSYLALRGKLPYALMSFLTDAHEQRGVLRQVGSVYQFRHQELQHHLAARHQLPDG